MSRLLKWIRFSQMIRIRPYLSDPDPKHCQKHHCFVVEIRFKYSFLVNEGGGGLAFNMSRIQKKFYIFYCNENYCCSFSDSSFYWTIYVKNRNMNFYIKKE